MQMRGALPSRTHHCAALCVIFGVTISCQCNSECCRCLSAQVALLSVVLLNRVATDERVTLDAL